MAESKEELKSLLMEMKEESKKAGLKFNIKKTINYKETINNLRYADDTTLMAESKEELKNLLMKLKEESEKAGLKLNVQKMKIMASSPITSWQIDGETMEIVNRLFSCAQNHCRW